MAAVLHFRKALKDGGQECAWATNLREIFEALRAEYGTSQRKASVKLTTMRKKSLLYLQKHATVLKRLVGLAYVELPKEYMN